MSRLQHCPGTNDPARHATSQSQCEQWPLVVMLKKIDVDLPYFTSNAPLANEITTFSLCGYYATVCTLVLQGGRV